MLVRSDIHRSISAMTLNLHKNMQKSARQYDDYRMGEREFQHQVEFKGQLGILPVQKKHTIGFNDNVFIANPGMLRDSGLPSPQARFAIEITEGPEGLLTFAHVVKWHRDDRDDYTGVVVVIGVHCPALSIGGHMPSTLKFKGVLHASFQGFGLPADAGMN